jgi:hypothetical protein
MAQLYVQVARKLVTKTRGRCEEIKLDPVSGISERKRGNMFLIAGWKAAVRKDSPFQRCSTA